VTRTATLGRRAERPAQETRRRAETGTGWYAWLARTGLVAKGVSFGIVGVLALELALGHGGKATSRQGALQSLAHDAAGKILLAVLAAGFAAYAAWRFVQAFAEGSGESGQKDELKTWGKRAGYAGRGLIYSGLTYSTIRIAMGSSEESQNEKAHHTTAVALAWPGGRFIVGAAGVAVIGAGLWNLYRGLARTFEKKWRRGRMSARERRFGSRAGVVGHVARFVVFALVGVFVTKAAVEYDPKEAIGLDGALQKLAHESYGPWLLGLTATGLVAYAVYCLVDARYRDVSTGATRADRSD
jgi:hypothetical protein